MSYLHETKYVFQFSIALHIHIFGFFTKMIIMKGVHPLKVYHHTEFCGHMLSGSSFVSMSEVLTSTILECLKLQD